jgi:polysaccharide export outer membrane protein
MTNSMGDWIWRVARLVGVTLLWLTALPGPAHAQYKIGPEDVLHIAVLGNKDLEMTVTVQPDGRIFFPMVGEVQAAGLTVAQLTEQMTRRMQTLIRDAVVGVTVREVNSYKVFLVGAVMKPGPYPMRSDITLLQLLSLGGGVAPGAELGQAYIVRRDARIPVNVKKLLDEGDPSQNPVLLPGDTVVIPGAPAALLGPAGVPGLGMPAGLAPETPVIFVMGEVRRPGSIPFAKDLTVVKALALAGGFTPFASPSKVMVIRVEDAKRLTLPVNVTTLLKGGEAQDIALRAGDVIHVPESLF